MKRDSKFIAAIFLANMMLASGLSPAFAQGYNPYPSHPNTYPPVYNQNLNRDYNSGYNLPPLQGRVATAPAGTIFSVTLPATISSQFTYIGDTITTRLGNDLYIGGSMVLPAGTQVEGKAVEAEKAGNFGKNGKLNIRFTSAITPNGQRVPISGKIVTEDGTGVINGGTMTGRLVRSAASGAIGAGLGAALGTGLGAASGGKAGKGATYGTAIGGGVGLLSNAFRKGAEAIISSNSKIDIILDQPLTVNPSPNPPPNQNYNPNYNY